MSQSDKSFTVSDRRHFTAEGRPRDEASESPGRAATAAAAAAGAYRSEASADPPADFSRFLLGLAAEAGRLLAGEGVPDAAPPEEELRGARSIIAILEMLRDKSEGRRSAGEDALLADLLFQLRIAYVERTRAGRP
jgi:hypothetical protein